LIAQPYRRFADLLQVTLDGGDSHRFVTEPVKSSDMPATNSSIMMMEFRMSRKD